MIQDNFFNKVYDVVRQIPEGKVTSYGEIGKFVHIIDPEGNKIELWEPSKLTVKDKK